MFWERVLYICWSLEAQFYYDYGLWEKEFMRPICMGVLSPILGKSMSFELRVCKWSYICVLEKFSKYFEQAMHEFTFEITLEARNSIFENPKFRSPLEQENLHSSGECKLSAFLQTWALRSSNQSRARANPLYFVEALVRGSYGSSVDWDQPVLFLS